MINPPFPYNAIISRKVEPSDPFEVIDDEDIVIYDGECDFENNRFPSTKNGVQVGRYKLYIPDNTVDIRLKDSVELRIHSRVMTGVVTDIFPTNFGLTVNWDSVEN